MIKCFFPHDIHDSLRRRALQLSENVKTALFLYKILYNEKNSLAWIAMLQVIHLSILLNLILRYRWQHHSFNQLKKRQNYWWAGGKKINIICSSGTHCFLRLISPIRFKSAIVIWLLYEKPALPNWKILYETPCITFISSSSKINQNELKLLLFVFS